MVNVQVRLGTLDKQDAIFLRHLLNKASKSAHDPDTVDTYHLRLRGRGKRSKVAEKKGYDAERELRVDDAQRFAIYLNANNLGESKNELTHLRDVINAQALRINERDKEIATLQSILDKMCLGVAEYKGLSGL